MKLVFTSFRDSIGLTGLKVSIDRHTPKLCSYATLEYLIMPNIRNLNPVNAERVCQSVLDNNWELFKGFVEDIQSLGIDQIILCDWATKEQITNHKFCPAWIIGRYIQDRMDRDSEFEFKVEVEFRDGREAL